MKIRRTKKSGLRGVVEGSPDVNRIDQIDNPERKRHQKKVEDATKRLMNEHEETLKKLAR